MLNDQILCIKIAHTGLNYNAGKTRNNTWNSMPFSRIYLVPNNHVKLFKRVYPYYLSSPYDATLKRNIDNLYIAYVRQITVCRDDDALKNANYKGNYLPAIIPGYSLKIKYTVVIPTYAKRVTAEDKTHQYKTILGYLRTAFKKSDQVREATLQSTLTVHTPAKTIDTPCLRCTKQLDSLTGKCALLNNNCQGSNHVTLSDYKTTDKEPEIIDYTKGPTDTVL